ncbi:MAG: DJ-1/PfpI family protein [Clostridia bacterium]|nr:DJ-1/PfpI family protein [Clostridia bacterium]
MTRTVGIYLFDEAEVLDFAGPFEVFSTASRVKGRLQPGIPKPFEVYTIADSIRTVRARGGLMIQPHYDVTNHPHIDVLIIPGGVVTSELQRETIIDWIARTAQMSSITASVCTGAFLLGKAGLLYGKSATTHWEDIADFRAMFPDVNVQSETRWVDTDRIVTSAGISAGLDMSLYLVARLEGHDLAVGTARQMEYDCSIPVRRIGVSAVTPGYSCRFTG